MKSNIKCLILDGIVFYQAEKQDCSRGTFGTVLNTIPWLLERVEVCKSKINECQASSNLSIRFSEGFWRNQLDKLLNVEIPLHENALAFQSQDTEVEYFTEKEIELNYNATGYYGNRVKGEDFNLEELNLNVGDRFINNRTGIKFILEQKITFNNFYYKLRYKARSECSGFMVEITEKHKSYQKLAEAIKPVVKENIEEMKYYITYLGYCNNRANRLQEAFYEFCKAENRTMFPETELEAYKANLYAKVKALNEEHKRCRPLEIKLWQSGLKREEGEYVICNSYGINYYLYLSNNYIKPSEEPSNPTYEEVLKLKSEYELEMYRKPRLINTGNYYHKTSGVPLDVATVLYNCAIPYTPEKFKKYLEKRSIPIEHIKTLNEYLDKHFEIIDGKLNLTT